MVVENIDPRLKQERCKMNLECQILAENTEMTKRCKGFAEHVLKTCNPGTLEAETGGLNVVSLTLAWSPYR